MDNDPSQDNKDQNDSPVIDGRPEIKPLDDTLKIEPQVFYKPKEANSEPVHTLPPDPTLTSTSTLVPDADLVSLPEITPVLSTNAPASNSGLVVLQWLSYAFWGWALIALSYLLFAIFSHFMGEIEFGDPVYYGIAAALVLLPVSLLCDFFYSKKEPQEKTGFASVVMVLHAVIFGLVVIGSLVTVAFSITNLLIGSSDSVSTKVTLYSALATSVLGAAVFLRVIASGKSIIIRRWFTIFMLIACGAIIMVGLLGPVAEVKRTRNDRLIEANINFVQNGVERYVSENNKLPDSLNDIELTGDAKSLVAKKMIAYKNDGKIDESDSNYSYGTKSETYRYQLCVNFAKKSSNDGGIYTNYLNSTDDDSDGYSEYLSTYSHKAGNVCYKLETTSNGGSSINYQSDALLDTQSGLESDTVN